jgi:hypothetical protein
MINFEVAAIGNIEKFKEEFAREFLDRVKSKTPVDTGRLQDGWEAKVAGSEIEVSNAVPYAVHVERGTAHTAPVGMLAVTVLEADQIADQAARNAGFDAN